MKKNFLIFSLAFVILLPSCFVSSRPSELEQLNLTLEQKEQIKALKRKHSEQIKQEIDALLTDEQKSQREEIKAQKKAARKAKKIQSKNKSSSENLEN